MPGEPAPEIDPLLSLKEADRRRGGCGAFLIGAVVLILILLTFFIVSEKFSRSVLFPLSPYGVVAAFVVSIAGGIKAAALFTRLRVQRMDRKAAEVKDKPAGPTSP
jgi:hypothetical protein